MSQCCPICLSVPSPPTFIDCGQCLKRICTGCFSNLRALECPYCRHAYTQLRIAPPDDSESDSDASMSQVLYIDLPFDDTPMSLRRSHSAPPTSSSRTVAADLAKRFIDGDIPTGYMLDRMIEMRFHDMLP